MKKKRKKRNIRKRNEYLMNYIPKQKHAVVKKIIAVICILLYIAVAIIGTVNLCVEACPVNECKAFTYTSSYPEDDSSFVESHSITLDTCVSSFSSEDISIVAKTVYGEALVTNSDTEMAAVVWCILNRVDSPKYPDSVTEVVTQKKQFHGYNENNPVDERIERLVKDVFDRYDAEKNGTLNVGRILPAEYLYFYGDGRHNHYTTEWCKGPTWDWSLISPYAT